MALVIIASHWKRSTPSLYQWRSPTAFDSTFLSSLPPQAFKGAPRLLHRRQQQNPAEDRAHMLRSSRAAELICYTAARTSQGRRRHRHPRRGPTSPHRPPLKGAASNTSQVEPPQSHSLWRSHRDLHKNTTDNTNRAEYPASAKHS